MAETPQTKIEQAAAAVRAIETEISDLRFTLGERRGELGGLRQRDKETPGDPEVLARIGTLERAVKDLERLIPLPPPYYKPGDARPEVQIRLDKAKDNLLTLRRQRANLARQIAALEDGPRAKLGTRLPEVIAMISDLRDSFAVADLFPPGCDERLLLGWGSWAKRLKSDLESLPILHKRLAEFGEDPDGPPPEQRRGPPLTPRELEHAAAEQAQIQAEELDRDRRRLESLIAARRVV